MPYFHVFLWDGENDEHLAEHGVTRDEFEFVVLNAFEVGKSHSSSRPIVFGETLSGRRLACIYEMIDDITCYPSQRIRNTVSESKMAKPAPLQLTAEQKQIVSDLRAQLKRERPDIVAEGQRVFAVQRLLDVELRGVFSLLQAVRKAQGVSISDLAARTGISKSALSKMENDPAPNVQLTTLQRIAAALGKELRISVAEAGIKNVKTRRRAAARQ